MCVCVYLSSTISQMAILSCWTVTMTYNAVKKNTNYFIISVWMGNKLPQHSLTRYLTKQTRFYWGIFYQQHKCSNNEIIFNYGNLHKFLMHSNETQNHKNRHTHTYTLYHSSSNFILLLLMPQNATIIIIIATQLTCYWSHFKTIKISSSLLLTTFCASLSKEDSNQ